MNKQSSMKRSNLYTESGEPKRIRCYMFKQEPKPYCDWVTVVFTYANNAGYPVGTVIFRTMSGDPFHPLGIGMWGEHDRFRKGLFRPGGSRVKFSEIPEKCQELVRMDYKELWEGD
ncbi:MAG: hypothetical protein FWH03_05475 [Firmicutes bacterium]|nr:hypothetical protein [Bacillota bacterium]